MIRVRRVLVHAVCLAAVAGGLVTVAPGAAAQNCAPGFVPNPYGPQCLAPVSTPTINGVPCVPSKLALCQSFLQNQQPPRPPRSSAS